MRLFFVSVIILLLGQVICEAQSGIFDHSTGDGFSSFSFFETNCSNGIFNHGAGDGFDSEGFLESIASGTSIFKHGMGDGFHVAHYSQTSLALNNNIFNHAEGDGFSFRTFLQPGGTSNNLIFTHSAGDGFSFATLTQSLAGRSAVARVATEEVISEKTSQKLVVFPNPSKGALTIQFDEVDSNEKRVQLINLFGVIVFDRLYTAKQAEINVEPLPKGVYVMYVFDADNTFNQRIVIY